MIKIHCRSNLDLMQYEKFPTELPVLPQVGNLIESATAWGKVHISLEVVQVKWKYIDKSYLDIASTHKHKGHWKPEIELSVPRGYSLDSFYEWYGQITGKSKHAFI